MTKNPLNDKSEKFMLKAIELAKQGLEQPSGRPFGAIIVKNDEIIGQGKSVGSLKNDPTAHAEIEAIRDACQREGNYHLENAEIYSSCEPCPMCLAAIYLARIKTCYYGCSTDEAGIYGFSDKNIYDEICKNKNERKILLIQSNQKKALEAFSMWKQYGGRR